MKPDMTDTYPPHFTHGCSDGSCLFRRNTGMVTNGGCSCARELRRTAEGELAYRTILYLRGLIYKERSSKP